MKLSPREGVYYLAWMAGIIATVPLLEAQGVNRIVALLLGLGIGYGLGLLAERAYDNFQQAKSDDDDTFGGNRDDHLR